MYEYVHVRLCAESDSVMLVIMSYLLPFALFLDSVITFQHNNCRYKIVMYYSTPSSALRVIVTLCAVLNARPFSSHPYVHTYVRTIVFQYHGAFVRMTRVERVSDFERQYVL